MPAADTSELSIEDENGQSRLLWVGWYFKGSYYSRRINNNIIKRIAARER